MLKINYYTKFVKDLYRNKINIAIMLLSDMGLFSINLYYTNFKKI